MAIHRGTDINTLLASHDKRYKEASGILSRLYRIILMQRQITPYKWNMLLTNYLDHLTELHNLSQDKITNERNNLRKGLNDPDMTFGMLTRGLAILNPKAMEFEVELLFADESNPEQIERSVIECIDMLSEDDIELGKLSSLYRKLLTALGKDVHNLDKEIDEYLSNDLLREDTRGRKRGNDKGNLRRELPGADITWEVFKKGLRVLAPTETIIRVKLGWGRAKPSVHELRIISPKRA